MAVAAQSGHASMLRDALEPVAGTIVSALLAGLGADFLREGFGRC